MSTYDEAIAGLINAGRISTNAQKHWNTQSAKNKIDKIDEETKFILSASKTALETWGKIQDYRIKKQSGELTDAYIQEKYGIEEAKTTDKVLQKSTNVSTALNSIGVDARNKGVSNSKFQTMLANANPKAVADVAKIILSESAGRYKSFVEDSLKNSTQEINVGGNVFAINKINTLPSGQYAAKVQALNQYIKPAFYAKEFGNNFNPSVVENFIGERIRKDTIDLVGVWEEQEDISDSAYKRDLGRASLLVDIKAINPETGESKLTADGFMEFITVIANGVDLKGKNIGWERAWKDFMPDYMKGFYNQGLNEEIWNKLIHQKITSGIYKGKTLATIRSKEFGPGGTFSLLKDEVAKEQVRKIKNERGNNHILRQGEYIQQITKTLETEGYEKAQAEYNILRNRLSIFQGEDDLGQILDQWWERQRPEAQQNQEIKEVQRNMTAEPGEPLDDSLRHLNDKEGLIQSRFMFQDEVEENEKIQTHIKELKNTFVQQLGFQNADGNARSLTAQEAVGWRELENNYRADLLTYYNNNKQRLPTGKELQQIQSLAVTEFIEQTGVGGKYYWDSNMKKGSRQVNGFVNINKANYSNVKFENKDLDLEGKSKLPYHQRYSRMQDIQAYKDIFQTVKGDSTYYQALIDGKFDFLPSADTDLNNINNNGWPDDIIYLEMASGGNLHRSEIATALHNGEEPLKLDEKFNAEKLLWQHKIKSLTPGWLGNTGINKRQQKMKECVNKMSEKVFWPAFMPRGDEIEAWEGGSNWLGSALIAQLSSELGTDIWGDINVGEVDSLLDSFDSEMIKQMWTNDDWRFNLAEFDFNLGPLEDGVVTTFDKAAREKCFAEYGIPN